MEIFVCIISGIFSVIGCVGVLVCLVLRPLHVTEVEVMKKPEEGIHKGEPSCMKDFREIESEFELEANSKWLIKFSVILAVGLLILSFQIL